jgi:hypothetical protein
LNRQGAKDAKVLKILKFEIKAFLSDLSAHAVKAFDLLRSRTTKVAVTAEQKK